MDKVVDRNGDDHQNTIQSVLVVFVSDQETCPSLSKLVGSIDTLGIVRNFLLTYSENLSTHLE